MANKTVTLWELIKNYGFSWLVARLMYELQGRAEIQTLRFRQRHWAENELAHWLRAGIPSDPTDYAAYRQQHRPSFFFQAANRSVYAQTLQQVLGEAGWKALVDEADQVRRGDLDYFFARTGRPGFPPDWHRNPFTGQGTSPHAHWSHIPMFSPATGDLKFIWEPGRFASAFTLARAYWATGNDSYAETFWQLVESWASVNPPNQGAHWRCGQETALRLMAWCFALFALGDSPTTSPERLALIVGLIAVQADRIARDHAYAYLQQNNHAISEGMGLWTVGILFPELKRAEKWREAGRKILEEEAKRQIDDDGAYIQHSTNYQRLMLHDYLWAIRLGEVNGYELSPGLRDRVRQAGEFLYQLQDEASGSVPNYGANDGALILPLNSCQYSDFRPVLGGIHYLLHGTRLYQKGAWDEDLIWLFGPEALEADQADTEKRSLQARKGGYYTLRGGKSWGMIRCASFQDRPSQADMLHLDIWRAGVNVACDPGTNVYYADPPWNNSLVSTLVHNTVSVDMVDQMARGPHFLWLTWLKSKLSYHLSSDENLLAYFEGAHDGYRRLAQPVTHRRAVLKADEDIWIIVDDLTGQGEHKIRLHWLLADFPLVVNVEQRHVTLDTGQDSYGLSLRACVPDSAPSGFDVVRGTETSSPRGWRSTSYGVRQPAVSVAFNVSGPVPCRLVSLFAPEQAGNHLSVSAKQIRFESSNLELTANLLDPESVSIFKDVSLDTATRQEHLTIC
jgi:hypothetical protein